MHHVTRGYFGLPEIWARNVETFHGNSDRRRGNSAVLVLGFTGPDDRLVLGVSPADRGSGPHRCACGRDHRAYQRVQPGDDLSHGCQVRYEQCDHAARVGPLLQL